jgi:hypothetical protein
MDYDDNFLNIFNECYPFEHYIFREPKSIGITFEDIVLIELFVPYTEIKPITSENGSLITFTRINKSEVYVKVRGNAGEMRFGYFDFSEPVREEIRTAFIVDFGEYNYESLYVDHEGDDNSDLKNLLGEQAKLIKAKYGECKIKKALRDNLVEQQ